MNDKLETVAEVELEIDNFEVDGYTYEDLQSDYLEENHSLEGFDEWFEERLEDLAWDYIYGAQGHNDLHLNISIGDVHLDR